jgi:hypothetical protein
VQPFRIAILVFIVGASAANFFAWKTQHDRWTYSAVATMEIPSPLPTESTNPAFNPNFLIRDPNRAAEIIKLRALAEDEAYFREAIILTIGGVAWFLVRAKA